MPAGRHGRFFISVLGGSPRADGDPVRRLAAARQEREAGKAETAGPDPAGSLAHHDPAEFDPVEAALHRRLPCGTAQLHVYRSGPDAFGMRGFCCCAEQEELGAYGRPDLDLENLVSPAGEFPAQVLQLMRAWSRSQDRLTGWLHGRRARHNQLQLVIWDETAFRIPWELFWLDSDLGPGLTAGWLGGLLTVTRWLTIRTPAKGIVKGYGNQDPYECAGPVAAFVAPAMSRDVSLFSAYQVEYADSMEDLATGLGNLEAGALAMVYVACDGESGAQPAQYNLGHFTLYRAYELKFRRLQVSPAIVFLNACNSGALGLDTARLNDGALQGFAEVFLREGAAGVLAINGAIGTDTAHDMARDLLEYLDNHPGESVPDAVRELRRQAAGLQASELSRTDLTAAEASRANERLLLLLFRFMYVYYGSPRTVLTFAGGNGLP